MSVLAILIGAVTAWLGGEVVTLVGSVSSERQARHIEGGVKSALQTAGLKYAEIANESVVAG